MKTLSTLSARMRSKLKEAGICVVAGRLLFALTVTLLVVMPWTEYFWNFDKFLRGGQDFEMSLLAVLTLLCLAVVLLQRRKMDVVCLLTKRRWLPLVLQDAFHSIAAYCHLLAALLAPPLLNPYIDLHSFPIQV